jgi:hypothetical protein
MKCHCLTLLAVGYISKRDHVVRDLPGKVDGFRVAMFYGSGIEADLTPFDVAPCVQLFCRFQLRRCLRKRDAVRRDWNRRRSIKRNKRLVI